MTDESFDGRSPIIQAKGARPFMDAGGEIPAPGESVGIRADFEMVCSDVLAVAHDWIAKKQCDASELPDGLVDPVYRDGRVSVLVGELPRGKGKYSGYAITVTYSDDETDEDGSVYDRWRAQSTYALDERNVLIREDRVPPSDDDSAMADLEFKGKLDEIASLGDRQLNEIIQLGREVTSRLASFPVGSDIEAHMVVSDAEFDRRIMAVQHEAERTAVADRHKEASRRDTEQGDAVLMQLGMNRQPVLREEAEKVFELTRLLFDIRF